MRLRYPQPANEDEFEEFCVRLYRRLLKRDTIVRYGKRGERQDGIDLIDQLVKDPVPVIQCKLHEPKIKLSAAEVRSDVAKAEKSKHRIDKFIVATTAGKNRYVQDAVLKLNSRPASARRFTVEVYFWEDICARLDELPRSIADFIVYGKLLNEPELGVSIKPGTAALDDYDYGELPGDLLFPEIHALFDERKIEAAEHEISKLPNGEALDGVTADTRYAILRLRGKVALEHQQFDEAARLFELAYYAQPLLERARLNHILALQLRDQHAEAYSEAASMLTEGCTLPGAVSLLIRSAQSYEDILKYRPQIDEHSSNEEVNVALAQRLVGLGHFAEAKDAAQRALDQSQESAHAHMAMAMIDHQAGIEGEFQLRMTRLDSAIYHYSEAIRLANRDKYHGVLPEVFSNRARVQGFLGRTESASADYRACIEVAANPGIYLPDAVSYFLSIGDTKSASELARRLDVGTTEGQFLNLVVRYSEANRDERRLCINEMGAIAAQESTFSSEALFFAVQWAIELGEPDLAHSLVLDSYVEKHPFQGNTLRAWIQLELRNRDEAARLAEAARSESATSAHRQEIAILARIFNRLGADEDALPYWEQVYTAGILDENCKQLLTCAERLERHDILIRVCGELRTCDAHDKVTRRLEIQLLSRYVPEEAYVLVQKYIAFDPEYFRASRNLIALRLGHRDKVELDRKVLPKPGDLEPKESYLVVKPYLENGNFDEAIEFLYQQLRCYFDDEYAHGQYIRVVLEYGERSTLCHAANVVGPESAVLAENTLTRSRRWIVFEGESPSSIRDEFAPDSQVATLILGKTRGDTFISPGSEVQRTAEAILEIQSKYVRLFQDALNGFQRRFPGAMSFQSLHLEKDGEVDPGPLVRSIEDRQRFVDRLLDFYKSNGCPLYYVAKQLGKNQFQIVRGFCSDDEIPIRCAAASPSEFDSLIASGIGNATVVLDLSAAVTLARLDAWKSLSQSREYVISQAAFDAVTEWKRDLEIESQRGRRSAWVGRGGKLILHESGPEEIEEEMRQVAAILENINAKCMRKSSISIASFDPKRRATYLDAFGYSTLESISIAKDIGCPLWIDDFTVAQFARADFGITCIWTQLAIEISRREGAITVDECEEIAAKLSGWGFVSTIWSARTLAAATRVSHGDATKWPLKQCIETFRLNPRSFSDRAEIALSFFNLLPLTGCLPGQQLRIIHATLNAIGDRRVALWILRKIANPFDIADYSVYSLRLAIRLWLILNK